MLGSSEHLKILSAKYGLINPEKIILYKFLSKGTLFFSAKWYFDVSKVKYHSLKSINPFFFLFSLFFAN